MKNVRAIYLPDLAFDPSTTVLFQYNKDVNKFEKMDDKEIVYEPEDLVEDEDWEVFETELKKDEELSYGEVNKIEKTELINKLKEV